jgi:GR25 family glycosyltransferase involved in LPS biosynthesis
MKKIRVLIISLKNSKRLPYLKKKLNNLKIKFKIIDGINGNYYHKKKRLDKISDEKIIFKTIGRRMSPSEIGAAASHIKAYKFIVKNNIDQAIIFEDDAIPSGILREWINNDHKLENNEILSFFAYPSGFLEKKPFKKILNNKISLHYSKTHIYSNSCYQINNYTCKKILSITKGKVIGLADWPFNTSIHSIKLIVTLPFLTVINDRGISNLSASRNKILGEKNILIKKLIPKSIFIIIELLYYIFFIPCFFGKYKNLQFYKEHFYKKKIELIKNYFFKSSLNLYEMSYKTQFYIDDLKEDFRKVLKFLK